MFMEHAGRCCGAVSLALPLMAVATSSWHGTYRFAACSALLVLPLAAAVADEVFGAV